jgi:hypothetical protein
MTLSFYLALEQLIANHCRAGAGAAATAPSSPPCAQTAQRARPSLSGQRSLERTSPESRTLAARFGKDMHGGWKLRRMSGEPQWGRYRVEAVPKVHTRSTSLCGSPHAHWGEAAACVSTWMQPTLLISAWHRQWHSGPVIRGWSLEAMDIGLRLKNWQGWMSLAKGSGLLAACTAPPPCLPLSHYLEWPPCWPVLEGCAHLGATSARRTPAARHDMR